MKNRLTWDEYFMAIAKVSRLRSKDSSTQVGACIVNEDNRIISIGYNGMAKGDDNFPWERSDIFAESKYSYVVHAEVNAILNAKQNLTGTKIYVSLFPCNECAKMIAQSGIAEVIYESDKYANSESTIVAKIIFDKLGVKYRQVSVGTIDV